MSAEPLMTTAQLVAEIEGRRGGIPATAAERMACQTAVDLGTLARDAMAELARAKKSRPKSKAAVDRAAKAASLAASRHRSALTGLGLISATATLKSARTLRDFHAAPATKPEDPATRGYATAHPTGLTADGGSLWPRPSAADWQILLNGSDDELREWQAARDLLL